MLNQNPKSDIWARGEVVSRLISIQKAPGSIPGASMFCFPARCFVETDGVASHALQQKRFSGLANLPKQTNFLTHITPTNCLPYALDKAKFPTELAKPYQKPIRTFNAREFLVLGAQATEKSTRANFLPRGKTHICVFFLFNYKFHIETFVNDTHLFRYFN